MNFDSEQTRAIQTVGTNILVSASAGAGKTGVLVARLVKRCVEDRVPLNRILAMTFTAAAAGEMKNRLAAQLHEKAASCGDTELLEYLNEQLLALETAQITTIDSWCLSIIEKYCNVIGLDPATAENILSEGMKRSYSGQGFRSALKQFDASDHEGLLKLLEYFSVRSEDYDTLYDLTESISAHAEASADPDEWYEKAKESYAPVRHFSDFDPYVRQCFFLSLRSDLLRLKEALDEMISFAYESEKLSEEPLKVMQGALQNCLNELDSGSYNGFRLRFFHLASLSTPSDGKAEKYTKARNQMKDCFTRLAKKTYDEEQFVKDHNDLNVLCRNLVTLAQMSRNCFRRLKLENTCMDYSDMERYALDILCRNNGEVAALLRDAYDEIMIDEFQDTSLLQHTIIEKIARGNNVFRVGDVKQSIYRFRQAKPSLMRGLMNDPGSLCITLRHNYRSRQSIVGFTNMLFEKLMNVDGCLDTYGEEDHVSIGSARQQESAVPVILALLPKPDRNQEDSGEDNGDDEPADAKQEKAGWIADEMVRILNSTPSVSFRDFAVLVKSHADKLYLRKAFEYAGIPYDIDAREGFYRSDLCQTAAAMCRLMLDETDQISLMAVLTSPWYDMDDETIASLKIRYGSLRRGILSEYPDFYTEMRELREIAAKSGLPEMLSQIALRHDFFNRIPDSQKANFDYLFELCTSQKYLSLREFTEYLDVSEDEKSSEAMSKGKDDDLVTVTTIHHSKGLQYKYVFLWGTGKNQNRDIMSSVLADDDLYIGLSHLDQPYRVQRPTLRRYAIEHKINLEDLEEFTRVLYVALTRAEEHLYIVDTDMPDEAGDVTLAWLNARKGMTGLIKRALKPSPLFQIIHAGTEKLKTDRKLPDSVTSVLPHYSGPDEKLPALFTPSSSEVNFLPPLDPDGHRSGTAYGTHMHEVLEALPAHMWTDEDLDGFDLSAGDRKKILDFGQSELYAKALTMQIYHEYPFYVETSEMRMHGIIDFAAFGKDEVLLIDYKTDRASPEEIRRRYTVQLNSYRNAVQLMEPGKKVSVYAWSFHSSLPVLIKEDI